MVPAPVQAGKQSGQDLNPRSGETDEPDANRGKSRKSRWDGMSSSTECGKSELQQRGTHRLWRSLGLSCLDCLAVDDLDGPNLPAAYGHLLHLFQEHRVAFSLRMHGRLDPAKV